MIIQCRFDPPHTHEYPPDWIFDGPNNLDPRADPRWKPTTYYYFNASLEIIFTTQTPLCDEEAIYEFTKVRDLGPGFAPVYIAARRPGDKEPTPIPVQYDPSTDEVEDI